MALNPNPIGIAIANYFVAQKPADGTAVTTAQLQAIWEGVMTLIYNDIKANMEVLPASLSGPSLTVPNAIPLTVNTGAGAGGTGVTTSPETVTGKGSVQ